MFKVVNPKQSFPEMEKDEKKIEDYLKRQLEDKSNYEAFKRLSKK